MLLILNRYVKYHAVYSRRILSNVVSNLDRMSNLIEVIHQKF